jgi:porin
MQSFMLSGLTRSLFLGALAGATFVGFCGVGSEAIAAHQESAAQPKNASIAVQPKDWVSQSLKSLIKRYKCESASKYLRSSDSPARYMMAFALNECLDQIGDHTAIENSQVAQALLTELKKETQFLRASVSQDCRTATLESQQFSTGNKIGELAATKDRVDFLNTQAATLELQQFSPTTKFQGQAIVTIQGGGFR